MLNQTRGSRHRPPDQMRSYNPATRNLDFSIWNAITFSPSGYEVFHSGVGRATEFLTAFNSRHVRCPPYIRPSRGRKGSSLNAHLYKNIALIKYIVLNRGVCKSHQAIGHTLETKVHHPFIAIEKPGYVSLRTNSSCR